VRVAIDTRGIVPPDHGASMKTPLLAAALLLLPAVSFAQAPEHAGQSHRGHGGIERLDTDNDGRISRAEFDAGRAQREARLAAHPERAQRADDKRMHAPPDFAALDANRDGYIVRSELRAYHDRMRPQREAERKARFDERFKTADLNHDGKLGRVEVQEAMPRMADRFAWMDENRDGFLSRAELESGRDWGHERR
jgi:Ca2+-binding EF-hand superfamily protein